MIRPLSQRSSVALVALLFLLTGSAVPATEPVPAGTLECTRTRAYLSIPRVAATYKSGRFIPLIQKNVDYFVAIAQVQEGQEKLAAFPDTDWRKRPTGWVSNNKQLVFSRDASAVKGRFYPHFGEQLQVLQISPAGYLVRITRYGKTATLMVPKKKRGFEFHPAPPAPVAPSRLPEPDPVPASPAPPPSEILPPDPPPEPMSESLPEPVPAPGAEAPPPFSPPLDLLEQMDHSTSMFIGMARELDQHSFFFKILLGVVIVQAILITRLQRRSRVLAAAAGLHRPTAEDLPPLDPGAIESLSNLQDGERFSGSLRVFSVPELVQIIHSAKETGILSIQCDASDRRGRMLFREGHLSDAEFQNYQAEDAAMALLAVGKGGFSYLRSDRVPEKRRIEKETISLLITAVHRQDEQGHPAHE